MAAGALLFWLLCFEVMQVVSAEEFCNSEIFQPNCFRNEVIYITKAFYGRREYGRCLKEEGDLNEQFMKTPGYISCSTDVRHIIEPQCAGQQRCEVYVGKIEAETKCNKIFRFYLDAHYQCLKG